MNNYTILTKKILELAKNFGFIEASVTNIDIDKDFKKNYLRFLELSYHGEMSYLEKNIDLRFNPDKLFADTISIISVKLPYVNDSIEGLKNRKDDDGLANISIYAFGKDYHKILKKKLNNYAEQIKLLVKNLPLDFKYRCFSDSAPIFEIELAKKSGLGWRGKNTLLLNKDHGSTFFLGELFINLPLITNLSKESKNYCGSCTKCIDVCPTKAIIQPYVIDANKCISYLTIEYKKSIPLEYRKAIGNRIYGCDDCQLFCPWNKFSKMTTIEEFKTNDKLKNMSLIEAFLLDENSWQDIMKGSAIYRIGYNMWLRNVAIGLGNAKTTKEIIDVLCYRLNKVDDLINEHIIWALDQHYK